jgi:hypothetical protein
MPNLIVMGEGSSISGKISIISPEPLTMTNIEHHRTGDWLFVSPEKPALATLEGIQLSLRTSVEELLQVSGL